VATTRQTQAAKRNNKSPQRAAKRARTISKLPVSVRRDLGRNAAGARRRGGRPGRGLDDRTRQQLYDEAKKRPHPSLSSSRGRRQALTVDGRGSSQR
jgi:hypothetical protein